MKQNDPKYFDQRTIRRNIENGVIKEDEFQKFLKSLPDEAQNGQEAPLEDDDPAI